MTTLSDDDDDYTSTVAGEVVDGAGGNDHLTAAPGGGQLYGGIGNDTLTGGDGDDQLVGDNNTATGNDPSFHNILNGFGGNDTITSFSELDEIDGGDGDDFVSVWAQHTGQVVDGGADDDTLDLWAFGALDIAVNVVMGSTFSPTVDAVQGATFVNFENLIFHGGTGSVTAQGAAGDDTLIANFNYAGSFVAGTLKGGNGDDSLAFNGRPTNGIEHLDGEDGTDTLIWTPGVGAGTADLVIDSLDGSLTYGGTQYASFVNVENLTVDSLYTTFGTVDIDGTQGDNRLKIKAATSSITTHDGDDRITIVLGHADVIAGGGDDIVTVDYNNTESATVHGGAGDDQLGGGRASVILRGEGGDDVLYAYGSSTLDGGLGDDRLSLTSTSALTDASQAVLDGGAGRDSVSLELSSLSGFVFKADFTKASVTLANGLKILNCEAVTFTAGAGNDVLTASNDAAGKTVNKLLGLGGNDSLTASAKGAWLDGGSGDDRLFAGAGADYLVGGYNETNILGDTVSYARSTKGVTVDLRLTTAQGGAGDAKGDILSKIENLIGSGKNDTLTGDEFNPSIFASGKNRLDGGKGNDRLTGNGSADTFVIATGHGKDVVTDFVGKGADHDFIDLSGARSIKNYSDLKAHHLDKAGHDLVIDLGGGDSLRLLDTAAKEIARGDFLF